jgi:hypothetical protein
MSRIRCAIAMVLMTGAGALSAPAMAGEQIYTYTVLHPVFGDIGTFVDRIDHTDGQTRIQTQLRIAVHLVGVTAYRWDADGVEVMQGNRLISMENVGDRDGKPLDIHGKLSGGQFVVKSTAGTISAPPGVMPSDPWLVHAVGAGQVVSTATGQVVDVTVTGGEAATIEVQGMLVRTRHFVIDGDKRQEVWMAENNVPVKFRSIEDTVPIDFVLKTPLSQAIPGYLFVAAKPASAISFGHSDK